MEHGQATKTQGGRGAGEAGTGYGADTGRDGSQPDGSRGHLARAPSWGAEPIEGDPDAIGEGAYVYVMTCGPDVQKIGISNDVGARFANIKKRMPFLKEVIYTRAFSRIHAADIERRAHRALREFAVMRDWAAVSPDHAIETVERIAAEAGYPVARVVAGAPQKAASIGMRVAPAMKAVMQKAARDRHQTLSQWVEMLIERELATRSPPDLAKRRIKT